ncbi:tetratricopeptide repeat protein [Microbulbifer marinus]|uniref:Tetratricopeptide repeat-containing protein n=1 Tax=Microbulbifer marinus TaxID=658218 RepID=A0A1H4AMU6_9GAMM|nr:hypothetical protein [Microbulbifer marinus]SEA37077.1 hypothetical protein SAMN05216562_2882 [Microbulbifer marinus]
MQHRDHSSEDSTAIQPADFSFGTESPQQQASAASATAAIDKSSNPRLQAIVIGVLLLFGIVGVFWLLPQVVEKPEPRLAAATDSAPQPPAVAGVQASPYSDAEIAQQRRNVQKVLQEILMLKDELQERRIELWANEEFSAAQALAEEADGIYRQRKFMLALEKYRESLAAFQQLRDGIPERIERHIAEGNQALDSGDAEDAHKAFDLVLTISEEHPRGVKGKARAETLPEAWAHFTDGKEAFANNDLNAARDALQQSLAVDPETRPASELLPEVLSAITERDYSEAMSAGYAAIAEQDFSAAKSAFERAQKLKPSAEDPGIGLRQARNGAEQIRIDRLFSRARQQEQSEDWHGAVESYTALLKQDGSLVTAITGKARAEARAQLDDQLQDLLKDPLTLGSSKRNQFARQVLADARQLNEDTPRLQRQIEDLENALTKALIPLPVVFRSDRSTSVTIYHVGRLGNFDQREITLKPGRYTAVGTREGYRDVRREFTVAPGEETPTVVIQCGEKIIGANNG